MSKEEQGLNKRQAQAQKTRQLLIVVSLDMFVRNGYKATTIRDIASKASVSPGLVIHYFQTKEAILLEHSTIMKYGIDMVGNMLKTSTAPLETFSAIAEMNLQSFQQDFSRKIFLLANQIMSFDSIPKAAKEKVSPTQSIKLSIPLIKLGQSRGELKSGDPEAMAVAYWGILQGIAEILVWNPSAKIPTSLQVIDVLKK